MPEDNKKEEGKIVMETRMHCEECRFKVYKALNHPDVEDINIDFKNNKVTLKAPKVDAKKLFETAKKKSKGKITKLVYPDPKDEKKKDEEKKKEEKKPVETTVVLNVSMDCSSCTRKVVKAAWKIKEVHSVKPNANTLTLKGWDLDSKKVCEAMAKKTGKHVEIAPPKKEGQKKDGDKKDDNAKKEEKQTTKAVTEFYIVHAPQYFSDENPNACVVM